MTKKADFDEWDKVDSVTYGNAAWLWLGFEPLPENEPPNTRYPFWKQFKNDGRSARLRPEGKEPGVLPKAHFLYRRKEYEKLAAHRCERPPFLFPEDRKLDRTRHSLKAQNECKDWLTDLMNEGPKPLNKTYYREEAKKKFKVGTRAFDRAWQNAASKSKYGHEWIKPGRTPKS